ncbi:MULTISPECIES: S1 family peptidase [unclassified Luteococcus]|uniref:S1 family peptidase n=1 Tax=unclassified Luteococcus TaxID=2639923 RepID=UPI00313C3E80
MTSRGSKFYIVMLAAGLTGLTACSGGTPAGQESSPGGAQPSGSASATGAASSAPATSGTPVPATTPSAKATAAVLAPAAAVAPPASASPLGGGRAASLVRVQVNNCTAMAQGTGFFVAPNMVLTAGHLFNSGSTISVHSSAGVVRGELLGRDDATDVALVRLLPTRDGGKLSGTPLGLATAAPAAGSPVTMIGLPTGRDAHSAAGQVKQAGQQATILGKPVSGLVSHTANAQPGVSGAPLLDASGTVVAMELATTADGKGDHHAVPMATVAATVKQWQSAGKAQKLAACKQDGPPSMTSIHPDAPAIKTALHRYLAGITYATDKDDTGLLGKDVAWQGLSARLQQTHGSADKFLATFKGAKPTAANVDNLEITDQFTDTLIWTVQLEGPGKACQVRKQKVLLSSQPGRWVIDQVSDLEAPRKC